MEKEDLIVRLLCLANEKTCHVEVDAGKAVVKGIFVFDIPSRAPRLASRKAAAGESARAVAVRLLKTRSLQRRSACGVNPRVIFCMATRLFCHTL